MNSSIAILKQTRMLILNAVKDLTQEQWFAMPDGFDNNIAWNVGHIVTSMQGMVYRNSGLEMNATPEMIANFKPGTSPLDWSEQPDTAQILSLLSEHAEILEKDAADGKLDVDYNGFTTKSGLTIQTVEEAINFDIFHEGLHLGTVLALKNFVAPAT